MKNCFQTNKITTYLLLFLSSILILLITWGCSGTRQEYMFPMFVTSSLMFLIYAFSHTKTNLLEKSLSATICITILICTIQYFNPFLEKCIEENFSYFKSLDYCKWLPKSIKAEFNNGNPMRSLIELSTVLSSAIVFLHLFKNKKHLIYITIFFAINATSMGLFGIWQQENNIPIMYNKFYAHSSLFGTFYLSNAAGAFLNLAVTTSIAVFFYLFRKKIMYKFASVLLIITAMICSYSAYRTDSNATIILLFLIWIGTALIAIFTLLKWKKSFIFLGITTIISILFLSYYNATITQKITTAYQNSSEVKSSFNERIEIYKHSKDIIKNNLIYGTGGYSCQHLLTASILKDKNLKNKEAHSIKHAHSDIMEYCMDFGLIGVLIIMLCVGVWIKEFISSKPTIESIILLLGITISVVHSCMDMNLHIISTMIAFALVATASIGFGRNYE